MADNNQVHQVVDTTKLEQTAACISAPEDVDARKRVTLTTGVVAGLLALQCAILPEKSHAADTPGTTTTSAVTAAAKGGSTKTNDGRDFATLKEEEVDGLTRPEKKAYYAWKNTQLDATWFNEEKRLVDNRERAIKAERIAQQTTFVENVLASRSDGVKLAQLRDQFVKNDLWLSSYELLRGFCEDFRTGKCPPLQAKHTAAIMAWIQTI